MALSGTLKSTDYQGRYVQFSWTATQDTAKNQSTISWTLKGAGTAISTWYNAAPFYVNVAGTEKTSSTRIQLKDGTQVMSGTKTITHNTDGTASFSVTIKAAIYKASYNCSGSTTFTLNTIPRRATITSAPDSFSDEDTLTVGYSNPAKGSLQIGIYKTDGSTALVSYRAATGSSYKFTFTATEKTTLQNACKTANSMSVRIYLKTTIGSNTFYHYVTKTLKIVNANPIIIPTAIEEQDDNGIKNSTATGSTSRWIKGYSDIAYSFNEVLLKGATVKSFSVVCGSKSNSKNLSGVLYNVDSKDVVFTLIDSRGNKATKTISGTLVDYIKPTCTLKVSAALDGETTAKFTLTIGGNFFNGQVKAGVANALTLQYRYKEDDGSYGAWTSITPTINSNKYSATHAITGLDYLSTYTFQARVQDNFYLAHSNFIPSGEIAASAQPVFDWSKNDFNFNVPVYYQGLNLSGAAKALSTGYTLDTTGTTAGTGWTNDGFSAHLVGSNLRCSMTATRSSATAAGNITNETVLSVKIKHSGKIKGMYAVGFSSAGTGGVATFAITNATRDDTYIEFNINIAANATAITSTSAVFSIPVALDLSKY